MKKLFTKLQSAIVLVATAGPVAAFAQSISDEPPPEAFTTFEGLIDIVNKFLGWLFTVLMVVAAIFIVMSAFYYLTAGGEDEKIKKAKDRFIYAVVAIAIGLVATAVKFVVAQLIGVDNNIVDVQ